MVLINIPIDKSIESLTKLIKVAEKMPKKRQDRAIRLIKKTLFWITLFLVIIFAAYGRFMRGHSLW